MYPGSPCHHSTGSGCRAYAQRPEQCRLFQCGWIQTNSPLPDWMKPDEAKVMVLPAVRHWRGRPVDAALPVGKRIPPRALNWLKQFASRHGRLLIYIERAALPGANSDAGQATAYGPLEFQAEMAATVRAGGSLW